MTAPAVARAADVERLSSTTYAMNLLLDSSDTGGAVSAHRVLLRDGAEGAAPHRHLRTAELFYILSGEVDVLAGEVVLHVVEGDLVVVPPGLDHAFGAAAGADGELLIAVTPGTERFDFFRAIHAVVTGRADPSSLAGADEQYDIHPATAHATDVWRRHRSSAPG